MRDEQDGDGFRARFGVSRRDDAAHGVGAAGVQFRERFARRGRDDGGGVGVHGWRGGVGRPGGSVVGGDYGGRVRGGICGKQGAEELRASGRWVVEAREPVPFPGKDIEPAPFPLRYFWGASIPLSNAKNGEESENI